MSSTESTLFGEQLQPLPIKKRSRVHGQTSRPGDFHSSIWSFEGQSSDSLYRWYGTLPLGLVDRLLDLYAPGGEKRVLDPFMGTGTTIRAAVARGLRATGYDVNPLSCLVAECYLAGRPKEAAYTAAVSATCATGEGGAGADTRRRATKADVHDLDRILAEFTGDSQFQYARKWFRQDTLRAVIDLLFRIASVADPMAQRLLFVAAAQEIRTVASVDPRCTHHLVTKKREFIDPRPLVAARALAYLQTLAQAPSTQRLAGIHQGSLLAAPSTTEPFDFVLAHPPYLGVIHYHLIHRLATDLLHFVNITARPSALRSYDFSSETIRSVDISTDRSDKYDQFVDDMGRAIVPRLAPAGVCAVIIGDQRHKGHLRHPFTRVIQVMESSGLQLAENFIWLLQNNGGMHVLRRGHYIDHNYILVFKRR